MAGLTWLHLSDWHQKGEEFDRKVVRDALIKDIEARVNISENLETVDFIIFSGDVAFSGKKEEYKAAVKYLIEPVLKATGLHKKDMFIVPGNHDLDRDEFELLPEALKYPLTNDNEIKKWLTDEKKRVRMLAPFENYNEFVKSYAGGIYGDYYTLTIDEKKVALLLFNSSLMCGRTDSDYGKLIIGEPQIYNALEETKKADVRIAVMHHPFEELNRADRITVEARLTQGADIILCGHQHNGKVIIQKSTVGNCVIIPAGAAYSRRVEGDPRYINAYNFVYLDLKNNRGVIYLREWREKDHEWSSHSRKPHPDGTFDFSFKENLKADLKKLIHESKDRDSKAKSSLPFPGVTEGKKNFPQRKKISVLPFKNLGPPEDKYFADGIAEEITSRLTAVSGLGVISSTSAVQYNREGKTMKQIGEDLGVDYLLDGSVRWDRGSGEKSRVRITTNLIQVSDGTHHWSVRYSRVINDIFEVQIDIAIHVIQHLDITLLEAEKRILDTRPTKNIEAYNAYLRGMENARRAFYEKDTLDLAVQMFDRAVELDPTFTLAYAELSKVHSAIFKLGFKRTKERISKAKAAVDRALKLQPELPEAHLALGYYYYRCHEAYQQALEEFSIAMKGLPDKTIVLLAVALTQRRQGLFHEATNNLKSAIDLSPQNAEYTLERV